MSSSEKVKLPTGIRYRRGGYEVDIRVYGQRKTARAATLEEAIETRDRLKREGQIDQMPVGRCWTLQKAIDTCKMNEWDEARAHHQNDINTRAAIEYFGNVTLDNITLEAIDGYIRHLKEVKGNSNATINRKLSALRMVMRSAHARGGGPLPPKIPVRKENNKRLRFLDEREEQEHLKVADHWGLTEYIEAFKVLIDTGMRPNELINLRLKDVDLDANLLMIWENKTDHPRSIPMTARAREVIEGRCRLCVSREDRLFSEAKKGWMRNSWDKIKDYLGYSNDPHYIPYILRHTCCSRLVQRGIPLKVVQEWMGHKQISTTLRYAVLAPKDLFAAVKVLEQAESSKTH